MNKGKCKGGGKLARRIKSAMKRNGMARPVDLFKALVDNGYCGEYQTVLNWLDGRNEPQIAHLFLIARATNVSADFFSPNSTL